jgi:hypothetical protein
MRQENIDFLERNRLCYKEVLGHPSHGRSATLANKIDSELLAILREEFMPGYPAPSDCGNCLFNMVTILYEKFDEYLASQPKKAVVIQASFPKNDAPSIADAEYEEFLRWKEFKNKKNTVVHIHGETVETPEQRKARLSDPNRIIKRRAKRK